MPTLSTPYGYVRGRFLSVIGDTASDEDRLPDAIPASGTVTFTPVAPIRIVDGTPPITAIARPVTVEVDSVGDIRDPAGNPGVWLVTGQYTVSFSFVGVTLPAFPIEVTSAHTAESPLDLTLAAPIAPTPAVKLVVSEQLYLDTIAARDAAIAAVPLLPWVGTRAEYNALPTKDPARLYIVKAA